MTLVIEEIKPSQSGGYDLSMFYSLSDLPERWAYMDTGGRWMRLTITVPLPAANDNVKIVFNTDAAKRGVDVKIILPETTDSSLAQYAGQYFYSELLTSGVKLYRRHNVLLHTKTLVIDGVWSTVGSTNMDFWSFSTNDEVNAVILSREFAMEMEKLFAADLAASGEIRWEELEKRPLLSKIREWAAHLISSWL